MCASAAAILFWAVVIPRAPQSLEMSGWSDLAARTVPGAYHIHTTRSDGVGDKAAVAHAAARAGLKFIILTDHGDGTRPPDPPEYIERVLCLDAVEISTNEGHYVALDMARAPYPLGGSADAVVEDVARLGGFGIAAHPDSPKPTLRWTDERAPIDGMEWLNADSERRKNSRGRMIRAGLAYFFRPGPALASLMDRPSTLDRWDRLSAGRRLVGLAGVDAHGGIAHRSEDTGRSVSGTIGIPSYEASFRTFSTRVILERPLAGLASEDARAIYAEIRKGSVFTAIDAVAGPGLLDFRDEGGTLIARSTLQTGGEAVLLLGGRELARSSRELRYATGGRPGAYRVEVRIPGAPGSPPAPWIVSNPIYLGGIGGADRQDSGGSAAFSAPLASRAPLPSISPFPWRIEKDPTSSGILRTSQKFVELQYRLGEGPRNDQFVALASDLHGQAFGAVDLSLLADRPARVAVQARTADGRRWGRSVFVDPAGSFVHVPVKELRPIGAFGSVEARSITSILLVVDLTNAAPGRAGSLRVLSSALVQ